MRIPKLSFRKATALGVFAALTIASMALVLAKPRPPGPGPGPGGCPKNIACADVWDPVVCADGITYSNLCYADRACAPGPCVSTGGGPVEVR